MAEPPGGTIQVDDREIARLNTVHEHASKDKAMEMGKIGIWFGSRDNAVVYLAWSVILLAIIGGTVLAVVDSSLRPDMGKALAALAISALGYMFGRTSSPSSNQSMPQK